MLGYMQRHSKVSLATCKMQTQAIINSQKHSLIQNGLPLSHIHVQHFNGLTFVSQFSFIVLASCHYVSKCACHLSNDVLVLRIINMLSVINVIDYEFEVLDLFKMISERKSCCKLKGKRVIYHTHIHLAH